MLTAEHCETQPAATRRTLPPPPYVYQSLDGALFEFGDEAVLIGKFQGTPVGDFNEVWHLTQTESRVYDIGSISVDNRRRLEAGQAIWQMPKEFARVFVAVEGNACIRARVEAAHHTTLYRLDITHQVNHQPVCALRLKLPAERNCDLTLTCSSWFSGSLFMGSQANQTEKQGHILRIRGRTILGAPF